MDLGNKIIETLKVHNEGLKARRIASLLNEDKSSINSWLYKNKGTVVVETDYVWKLKNVIMYEEPPRSLSPKETSPEKNTITFDELGPEVILSFFPNMNKDISPIKDGRKIDCHTWINSSISLSLHITFRLVNQEGYAIIGNKKFDLDDSFFYKFKEHPTYTQILEWRKETAKKMLKVPLDNYSNGWNTMYLSYEIKENGCVEFEKKSYYKFPNGNCYFYKN